MHSIWLYEKDFIYNLDFDPKEWQWKKIGGLQENTFFNYQTKRDIDKFVLNLLTLVYNNCFGSYDGHNISWNLFPHTLFLAQDIAYV